MKLAKTEPLCALNHHHRGIWHIYPDFYHRCRNENIGPSGHKRRHVEILLFRGLLPMYYRHLVIRKRESVHYFLISRFQISKVHFLALENQRIDHKNLSSLCDFLFHEFKQGTLSALSYTHGIFW